MDAWIERIVQVSGAALEAEDRLITDAMEGSVNIHGEPVCGILRRDFREAYYQYVVGRSLINKIPFAVRLEGQNNTDMVLRHPDKRIFALVEMKTWWEEGAQAERELAGIDKDVNKLRRSAKDADYGIMLVFTISDSSSKRYVGELAQRIGIGMDRTTSFLFPTRDVNGGQVYFWTVGLVVAP